MNTLENLVLVYNALKPRMRREAMLMAHRDIHRLQFQWAREFEDSNQLYLKYIDELEEATQIPDQPIPITKFVNDSMNKTIKRMTKSGAFENINEYTREQWNENCIRYGKTVTALYIELLDSPDLKIGIKRICAEQGRRVISTLIDLNYELSKELRLLLDVITRRLASIDSVQIPNSLHYWPESAGSFNRTIERLKEENFIADIALAKEIFKEMNNPNGAILLWKGKRRELIYFLLLLYGNREYKKETVTEIAYRLFDFKQKGKPNSQFTSEVGVIEKRINNNYPPRGSLPRK